VRKLAALLLTGLVAAVLVAPAGASTRLKIGIYDEALALGQPNVGFAYLGELRPQVLRFNLNWYQVAPVRPQIDPNSPLDPAYQWGLYDQAVLRANALGAEVLFHVIGTPSWANGGQDWRVAPTNMADLQAFTVAAARRYSGQVQFGGMPAVSKWAAWNEPNLSTFLKPSWGIVGGRRVPVAARTYAQICNTVMKAVHHVGIETVRSVRVACGVTSPYGKGGSAISPLRFLREMKRAKARFDVYAHHPYSRTRPAISPTAIPRERRLTVSLGNIGDLFAELNRLYGRRKRVWITEYGYETNPPDPGIGVSWTRQAAWLKTAHTIARRHKRIDMFLWFLIQDEPDVTKWQTGLVDSAGTRKPAFFTYQSLPRL
jgi:hypothetical protein